MMSDVISQYIAVYGYQSAYSSVNYLVHQAVLVVRELFALCFWFVNVTEIDLCVVVYGCIFERVN